MHAAQRQRSNSAVRRNESKSRAAHFPRSAFAKPKRLSQVNTGSVKSPQLVFAVMANPAILKHVGRKCSDMEVSEHVSRQEKSIKIISVCFIFHNCSGKVCFSETHV